MRTFPRLARPTPRPLRAALGPAAVLILVSSAPVARQGVEDELAALRDRSWERRVEAHLALAARGAGVLPRLLESEEAATGEGIDGLMSLHTATLFRIAILDPEAPAAIAAAIEQGLGDAALTLARALALSPHVEPRELLELLERAPASARPLIVDTLAMRAAEAQDLEDRLHALLLDDDDPAVRWRAARALGTMRARDAESLAALERAARDEDPAVDYTAAWALGRLGAEAVPSLLAVLDGPAADPVGVALARAGPVALEGATARLQTLETALARASYLNVIGVLGAPDAALAEAVRSCLLPGKEPEERAAALLALPSVAEAGAARSALSAALWDEEPLVRAAAARACRRLGPGAVHDLLEDLAHVLEVAQPPDPEDAQSLLEAPDFAAAMDAIGSIAEGDEEVARVALRLDQERGEVLHMLCVVLLSKVGDAALEPILERMQQAPKPERGRLFWALALLGTRGQEALVAQLRGQDWEATALALPALGMATEIAPPAFELIEQSLESPRLRIFALDALSRYADERAARLVQRELRSWRDYAPRERASLIAAAARNVPDASGFVSKLRDTLEQDPAAGVRLAAVRALRHGERSLSARQSAARVFLERSGDCKRPVEGLDALALRLKQDELVATTIDTLRHLGNPRPDTVEAVAAWCLSTEDMPRGLSLLALRDFGPDAAAVAVRVSKNLGASSRIWRLGAAEALAAMGPDIGEVSTTLGNSLLHELAPLLEHAVTALENMGPQARPALPMLGFLLLREEPIGMAWVDAKQEEEDAAPLERKAVDESERYTALRVRAARLITALGQAHPDDAALARTLLELGARVGDPEVAAAAGEALTGL